MWKKALLLCLCLGSMGCVWADEQPPVSTVSELNLDQYLGKWHQIAAIPMFFQRQCARNSMAVYSKAEDGLIHVENSCETSGGETSLAIGRARVNPKLNSPGKLQVTFVSFLGHWIWSFGGDYWVMDLGLGAEGYEHSIVGHPDRKYLWVLSRKPELSSEELKALREKILAQKYDLTKIIITQAGEWSGKTLADFDR